MAEIKWIKIVTDVFDDEKILMIESMPDADAVIVIWFKLLCLAGKQNNSGVFLMGRMPYTDEMFSTIFRRPLNTVRMALKTFETFGMIEIINNTVVIPHWDKHQSLDSYEKKKERDRLYQAERRAAQKRIAEKSSDTSADSSSDVASQSRVDKKREDEIKADVDVDELLSQFPDIDLSDRNSVEQAMKYLKEQKSLYCMKGTLGKGVVFLTPEQEDDLLDKLDLDGFNYYIEKLADFIIDKNAKVANHYATILKWAREDSKVAGG